MATVKLRKRPSIFLIKIFIVGVLLAAIICYPLFLEYFDCTKNKITTLKAEKKELEVQLKVANDSNEQLRHDVDSLSTDITHLTDRLTQTVADNTQKDRQIGELGNKVDSLDKVTKTKIANIEDQNTIITQLNADKEKLESEKATLKTQRDKAQKDLESWKNQSPKTVTKEIEVIKYKDNPEQAKTIEKQTKKIKDLEIELDTLKKKYL